MKYYNRLSVVNLISGIKPINILYNLNNNNKIRLENFHFDKTKYNIIDGRQIYIINYTINFV